jgi:transcription termination factor Rho
MAVLDRSELQESPLSDLHQIASEIGLEGFRRLRKADLIDAILGDKGKDEDELDGSPDPAQSARTDRGDSHDPAQPARADRDDSHDDEQPARADRDRPPASEGVERRSPRRARAPRTRRTPNATRSTEEEPAPSERDAGLDGDAAPSSRRGRGRGGRERAGEPERVVEGIVEVLGNGTAFLRVEPPEASDADVYISAAQVRRCELVSGDRVSGPVRTPRRSERYPSLIRVEEINGEPADSVTEGTHYEDLPVSYPCERIALRSDDATLKAIEWLTPLGRGSRAVITGAARSGKTETLRRMLAALADQEGFELSLVLAGVRPEELAEWREGPLAPLVALTFAASPEAQGHALEGVLETAKRIAARGGDAVVLIDGLDGLHPHTARKVLAAARNLTDSGSLTVIATATRPYGGETTVIALDVARTSTGRLPALNLTDSGTLRPELLVGEEGAEAITGARAEAAEAR